MSCKPENADETRAEAFGVTLPHLAPDEVMHYCWQRIGMAKRMPMGGVAPLEWVEIAAFSGLSGLAMTPIEADVVMDMSRAYVGFCNDVNAFSIAPMERDG